MANAIQASLDDVVDLLLDAVCVVDKEGVFVFVSAGCELVFGYTREEMLGKRMIDLVYSEDRRRTLEAAEEIMSGHSSVGFKNRYVRKDGQIVHIQWSARWSEKDQLRIAVARDITKTERVEAIQTALYAISEATHAVENQLALFERLHHIIDGLIPAVNFAIALYDDANGEITFPYKAGEEKGAEKAQLLGSEALCAEVIQRGETLLLAPNTDVDLPEALRNIIGEYSLSWLGVPLKSGNGTIGALMLQSYSHNLRYTESDSELLQFISTQIADAIERKQMLARLQHMALYDQLTGLPNRELFYDRIASVLARAARDTSRFALLYLDLNRFKQVNDTFGHHVGDSLLQETAQRIVQCVRKSDTVARFGGDEFVILLELIDSAECSTVVADKITQALSQPFYSAEIDIAVRPSIGIAIFPEHGNDEQQLLRHADKAMYVAKNAALEPYARPY